MYRTRTTQVITRSFGHWPQTTSRPWRLPDLIFILPCHDIRSSSGKGFEPIILRPFNWGSDNLLIKPQVFFNGPTRASIFVIYIVFKQIFKGKNCRLERDSKSDHRSKTRLPHRALIFKSFLKLGQPRPPFLFVFLNIHFNFYNNKCEKCHVHPVYGARIWTHDLWKMNLLP